MKKIFTVMALLAFVSSAYARDTISIVGSSTVSPMQQLVQRDSVKRVIMELLLSPLELVEA